VDHGFETIDFDCFVESAFLCNVFYDAEVEFGSWGVWVRLLDFVCLILGANAGDYGVAVLKEDIEDVGGDETTSSWGFC
jgi:hypothetical protein